VANTHSGIASLILAPEIESGVRAHSYVPSPRRCDRRTLRQKSNPYAQNLKLTEVQAPSFHSLPRIRNYVHNEERHHGQQSVVRDEFLNVNVTGD
jgi:hypothetical protein